MKTIIIIQTVMVVIFAGTLKAQNTNKNNADSLKQQLTKILENAKDPASDYRIYLSFDADGQQNGYAFEPIEALTGKISINDSGIIFTTKKGDYVLLFQEELKLQNDKKEENNWIRYKSNRGVPINVAYCHNDNIFLNFEATKYNVKNFNQCYDRISAIANDFINAFNKYINVANEKNFELFEKNYRSKLPDGVNNENNTIPEEQRRLIVQANYYNNNKDYKNALKIYFQASQVNPFSYPAAYYNMALIAAELKNYSYAILNMKKYLLLMPDAEDARKAQDKIYEWEINIKKKVTI